MSTRMSASARVTLTVEVSVRSTWGEKCSVEQVHKQAAEEALGYIEQAASRDRRLKVVGKPKVTAVLVEREES